jgi:mono/diheme cytochrome c family protein
MSKKSFYPLLAIILIFTLVTYRINNYYLYSQDKVEINKQNSHVKKQKSDSGKKLYEDNCMSCHQSDGSGVPGMYPPLQKSDWVNGDKNRLIKIMLNGLQGEIEVNGESYIQSMPSHKYLTDSQISEVLSFIRNNFGNNASDVKKDEVTVIRQKKSK